MDPEQNGLTKSLNKSVIKLLLSISLLYVLMVKMDLSEVIAIVAGLDPLFLGAAILLTMGAVILSAYKWQLLLEARGWTVSLALLTRCYFVGLFMNNFLPSSIGGDLMRIFQVGSMIGDRNEAAASVVVERLLATIGLLLLAVIALVPNRAFLGSVLYPILSCFLLCLVLTYILYNPAVIRPLANIPGKWWQQVVAAIRKIGGVIQAFRSYPAAVAKVIVYSVMFQMVVVLINYYLLKAMDITLISLWHCTLMIPIISAVSMLPVSINGLGVREGAYVLLFGKLGLSAAQALTLSLSFFIIVTIVSLLGGVFFVMEREKQQYVVTRELQ